MKICFNETLDASSLENDLILCEKYGYDSMEIRLAYLKDYLEEHSMDELKQYFATHNIKPYGYNSIENVNFCTPEEWEQRKELFLFACEAVKELGGKSIVVVPTATEEMKEKTEQEIFEDSVKVLRELSDLARPYGSTIAWEPIGKELFCVKSARQGMDIVNAVDRDNVGLVVDIINLYLHNEFKDIDDLRAIPGDKIVVFHINDALDVPFDTMSTLLHREYPGDGIIDVDEVYSIVKNSGYDGPASLELFGEWIEGKDPEEIIKTGYEKTKAVIDRAG